MSQQSEQINGLKQRVKHYATEYVAVQKTLTRLGVPLFVPDKGSDEGETPSLSKRMDWLFNRLPKPLKLRK